jgi:hypothetical protein
MSRRFPLPSATNRPTLVIRQASYSFDRITVIDNKMRLVKRTFAKLALNAAQNDKSAHQQVRQNENVEA